MKPLVRRALVLLAAAGIGWYLLPATERAALQAEPPLQAAAGQRSTASTAPASDAARRAFEQRASGEMLHAEGVVRRTLADDRDGSPHQRFIINTDSGLSLLIAHNIALAPRLEGLTAGDRVAVFGEYEWNDQGGVMHWTHHDPDGSHQAGYIEWRGRRYQ